MCRFFRERGYCGRGERCRFHHIRSQCVRARYDMGHEAASDICIDLEGTPALVFCADGTVRLRCGIPREWEYFRALNVVMRAVGLRLTYDGDLDGDESPVHLDAHAATTAAERRRTFARGCQCVNVPRPLRLGRRAGRRVGRR